MKYVFIDANVLLSILDLREIRDQEAIASFFENKDNHGITFIQNSQLRHEVYALRDRKIKSEIDSLKGIPTTSLTRFIFTKEQNNQIVENTKKLNAALTTAKKEAERNAAERNLRFDTMMINYFDRAIDIDITDEIFNKADRRSKLNKAPGKSDNSLGDRIHWETLLASEACHLHIVTGDNDFNSELNIYKPKQILIEEWETKTDNKGTIEFDRSLTKFIEKIDEHIQFSENAARQQAIVDLQNSGSFATTHKAIESVNKFDNFLNDEISLLITALNNNTQIHLIATDDDVLAFYQRFERRGVGNEEEKQAAKYLGLDEDFFDPF